jgi:hypothetical protein
MLKTLVLDIETSPLLVYVWTLKDQYVDVSQLYKDWQIMAFSAKWLGEPVSTIKYYDIRNDKNDNRLLKILWKMLNETDILITQNGQAFDSKKITARFMLNGMKPPKPYRHLDTYLIVKKIASFTSNKLEYLTAKFCTKYKKLSHSRFVGLSLWKECLSGNREAWEEMKRYNISDTLSTEELYLNLRAWVPNNMPNVFEEKEACGGCGYRGRMGYFFRYTNEFKYTQYTCPKCGKWQKGKRIK